MKDIHAGHMPRSKSEIERTNDGDMRWQCIERVLNDWSDCNWLQFSTWDLYQIQAYLYRVLSDDAKGGAA